MAIFQKASTAGLFTKYMLQLRQFDKDLLTFLEQIFTNLENIINRGITFDDNFESEELTATAHATPDTEFSVAHTLGTVPTRFIVVDIDEGGVVYKGTTAWTATTIYLKCTTGGTAIKVRVF